MSLKGFRDIISILLHTETVPLSCLRCRGTVRGAEGKADSYVAVVQKAHTTKALVRLGYKD